MFSDKKVAAETSKRVLACGRMLDEIVTIATESKCDDLPEIKSAIAKVLGELYLEVIRPLYLENPELKPDELMV